MSLDQLAAQVDARHRSIAADIDSFRANISDLCFLALLLIN